MKLQTQPSGFFGCLIYSAAMVLDEDATLLCMEVGHNGQEEWWHLPGSAGKRGHHIQEIQDLFFARQRALARVELYSRSAPESVPQAYRLIWTMEDAAKRFEKLIAGRYGIIIGQAPYTNEGHAVAWDGKQVYDPNGRIYDIDQFTVKEAWLTANI